MRVCMCMVVVRDCRDTRPSVPPHPEVLLLETAMTHGHVHPPNPGGRGRLLFMGAAMTLQKGA